MSPAKTLNQADYYVLYKYTCPVWGRCVGLEKDEPGIHVFVKSSKRQSFRDHSAFEDQRLHPYEKLSLVYLQVNASRGSSLEIIYL
jgi:hypothetical protein